MKTVALLVALVVAAVGFTGVVAPDLLITIGRHLVTPAGMYVIGAMRVAVGILLLITAQASSAPRALRVIGAIVIHRRRRAHHDRAPTGPARFSTGSRSVLCTSASRRRCWSGWAFGWPS